MNYYIDFEATRFSNKIISIGCVNSYGERFYTLVKPKNEKIDKFISELTGISAELLEEVGVWADFAFSDLFNFIRSTNDGTAINYYCYGNADKDFIKHTLPDMEDARAILCAQAIAGNLIDYSDVIQKFFNSEEALSLRKVFMFINSQTEFVQQHNALEDAEMLKTVVEHLKERCEPEDSDRIKAIPSQKKVFVSSNPNITPKLVIRWSRSGCNRWTADTSATPEKHKFYCIDETSGRIKYFNDINIAAIWIAKYILKIKDYNKTILSTIKNELEDALNNRAIKYNFLWRIKE